MVLLLVAVLWLATAAGRFAVFHRNTRANPGNSRKNKVM
jgi:hypothetical protein